MKKTPLALGTFAFVLLFIIGSIFSLLWFFKPGPEIRNYPSAGKDIIAFGDSLVEGIGSTAGGGFVPILSERIGRRIVNLGRSGDTTASGLARVEEIFRYDPQVVILVLGGNDFLRKIAQETTFANLERIIERVQEKGAIVLLLGVKGTLLGDKAESYFKELSERRGTAYVPNILDGIFGKPGLMYDSIHPNDAGYTRIADRLYPELKKLIDS
ncbi:MAG: GDSL-type esterase/lipase family protein [bacterium]|nr:GDSL-type esterase/lipase family protein [bacterium]MDZ4284384.1 GDSL-type esterase/lipase family protein [Patescibacteria group bacterium]